MLIRSSQCWAMRIVLGICGVVPFKKCALIKLPYAVDDTNLVQPLLLTQAKKLLQLSSSQSLSLSKWCEDLVILPVSHDKSEKVFK